MGNNDFDNSPPRRMQPGTKLVLGVTLASLFLILALSIAAVAILGPSATLTRERAKTFNPDFIVSAQSLFDAYLKDTATADFTYNDKVLEVSGTVASVGNGERGQYIIFAVVRRHPSGSISLQQAYNRIASASASGVQGVRCYLVSGDQSKATEGQEITLRGRCAGMPLDVEIRDCEILPPSPTSPVQTRSTSPKLSIVSKMAPEIVGVDADGKKFHLSDYHGKVVLLDFWATY